MQGSPQPDPLACPSPSGVQQEGVCKASVRSLGQSFFHIHLPASWACLGLLSSWGGRGTPAHTHGRDATAGRCSPGPECRLRSHVLFPPQPSQVLGGQGEQVEAEVPGKDRGAPRPRAGLSRSITGPSPGEPTQPRDSPRTPRLAGPHNPARENGSTQSCHKPLQSAMEELGSRSQRVAAVR